MFPFLAFALGGALVKIYLPAIATGHITDTPTLPIDDGADLGGSKTILVAEDEHAVRAVVVRVLTGLGYTVLAAASGEPAFELAIERATQRMPPIDLLLTDVVMTGMGGVALVERMLSVWPDIKYLFVSGYIDHRFTGSLDGAPILAKPFSVTHLARRVREVLDADSKEVGETNGSWQNDSSQGCEPG